MARRLLWGVLGMACVLGMISCAAHPRSAVHKGWLRVGDLALPWPEHWRLLPGTPSSFPANRDRKCDCTRLGPAADNAIHPSLAPRLGLVWTGRDTLVLDTVQVALWPGDCAEPCYVDYDALRQSGGLSELYAAQEALEQEFAGVTLFHRVLPSRDTRDIGGHPLQHFNGSILRPGRSGIYFRGTPQQRPLALYGLNLHLDTIEELREMMKNAVKRGKG